MATILRYISSMDLGWLLGAYARYVPERIRAAISHRVDEFNAQGKMYRVVVWCAVLGILWGSVLASAEEFVYEEYRESSYVVEEIVITDVEIREVYKPVSRPAPRVYTSYVINRPVNIGRPVSVGHPVNVAHPVTVAHPVDVGHVVSLGHTVDIGTVVPLGQSVEFFSVGSPVGSAATVASAVDIAHAVDLGHAVEIGQPLEINRAAKNK